MCIDDLNVASRDIDHGYEVPLQQQPRVHVVAEQQQQEQQPPAINTEPFEIPDWTPTH